MQARCLYCEYEFYFLLQNWCELFALGVSGVPTTRRALFLFQNPSLPLGLTPNSGDVGIYYWCICSLARIRVICTHLSRHLSSKDASRDINLSNMSLIEQN